MTYHVSTFGVDAAEIDTGFRAVGREHSRRLQDAADGCGERRHDLSLKGSKVSVGLSAYSKLALLNEEGSAAVREVELLSGQHVSYFGQNPRALRQLRTMRDAGLISIEHALENEATRAIDEAEKRVGKKEE